MKNLELSGPFTSEARRIEALYGAITVFLLAVIVLGIPYTAIQFYHIGQDSRLEDMRERIYEEIYEDLPRFQEE